MTPATPTLGPEAAHDAVTAAMLRHRRVLTTLAILLVGAITLYVAVSLLRASQRPWLGMSMQRSDTAFGTSPAASSQVYIRSVRPGSPAAKGDVRPGDRVQAIDGFAPHRLGELLALHDRLRPGQPVALQIEREGQPLARTVITGPALHRTAQWVAIALRLLVVFGLFFGTAALVYTWRPGDPRALLFMLFSASFGASMLNLAVPGGVSQPPETVISLPEAFARINIGGFYITNLCALVFWPALLHFVLLFPRPRMTPARLGPLLQWAYVFTPMAIALGSPLVLTMLVRWLPVRAHVPALLGAAAIAAIGSAVLAWRRPAGLPLRHLPAARPLRTAAVLTLSYLAVSTTLLVAVRVWARPALLHVSTVLTLGTILIFIACVGLVYPVFCGLASWRSWTLSTPEERQQIRWPLLAIAWALGIVFVMSLLSFGVSWIATAPSPWMYPVVEVATWVAYSVIPISFAAAVLRYGLMDIRIIIRLTFFYALTTLSIYVGAVAIVLLVAALVAQAARTDRVATVVITLLAVALVEPLRRRMQRRTDQHFYQRAPDPVGVLARHGQALRQVTRRDDLDRRLVLALQEALPHQVAYVFRSREDQHGFVQGPVTDPSAPDSSDALPWLTSHARHLHGPTVLADQKTLATDEARVWERLGVELLLPVRQGDTMHLIVAIGRKRSDDAWQERDIELLSSLAAQTSMAIADVEAKQHGASLREAFDNQLALLPQQLPQPEAYSIAGAWHPALAVGGDYYDAWWLSKDAVAICIADVSGKGLAASLVMANLQATVKALAGPDVSPAEVCTRVNQSLAANLRRDRFVTFFYGVLRISQSHLRYANAGHNPPLLVSGDDVRELGLGDPALGLLRTHAYRDDSVTLPPGARLLLYTDGVTEGRSPDGEEFGMERLAAVVGRPHAAAGPIRDDVLSAIAAWTQGQFEDDVTLLAIVKA